MSTTPSTSEPTTPIRREIARLPRGKNREYRVGIERRDGVTYVTARVWYSDRHGEWWPVPGMGLNVPSTEAPGLVAALQEALEALP